MVTEQGFTLLTTANDIVFNNSGENVLGLLEQKFE